MLMRHDLGFDDLQSVASKVRNLFPEGVAIAVSNPKAPARGLFPAETRIVENAIERRRCEFAAGRRAARQAMAELGVVQQPVPSSDDRAPIWPDGLVGSISHTGDFCIAAVARADQYRSLGVDIEDSTPLEASLFEAICRPEELNWLKRQPRSERGLLAKLIFSAKEAAYKCQYPLTRRVFGFDGMTVEPNLSMQTFVAMIRNVTSCTGMPNRFTGRFHLDIGVMVCTVTLE